MEEEHADETMSRLVQFKEIDEGVLSRGQVSKLSIKRVTEKQTTHDRCSEGTIKPTPTLTDQLNSRLRYVRLSLTRLDVRECPPITRLRHELETQDTILGQEHVLREDVHTVDTLWTKSFGKRVVTMEVLLQWSSKNGAITVGRECTRQYGDVSETALQWLICSADECKRAT